MSQLEETVCFIYKTKKKEGMYLYVSRQDNFEDVPDELMTQFPQPEFVFELALTPERQLAKENVTVVIANLQSQGYHLQMPPKDIDPIDLIELPDSLNG